VRKFKWTTGSGHEPRRRSSCSVNDGSFGFRDAGQFGVGANSLLPNDSEEHWIEGNDAAICGAYVRKFYDAPQEFSKLDV